MQEWNRLTVHVLFGVVDVRVVTFLNLHRFGNKFRKRFYFSQRTRRFKACHIIRSLFNPDYRPRVTAGRQHGIHQEPAQSAVAIKIRMDVHKQKMSQNSAYGSALFSIQQVAQFRHHVTDCILRRGNVGCPPDKDLVGPVSGQVRRLEETGIDIWREKVAIP